MVFCVFWIDEIDKGFGGDGCSDGGIIQWVLVNVFIWMVEKQLLVFVVVIVNGVEKLLLELLCKGCFDEIFMFDLFSSVECNSIFELYLEWRCLGLKFFLDMVVSRSEGFFGVELEQIVIEVMYLVFVDNCELMELDLIGVVFQFIFFFCIVSEQFEWLK